MRGELVAIDLETTGLDAARDSIIEVGAVRLRDGKVVEEYSQLVDPGFPIPPMVTHLTGIHSEDVLGQPTITAILPALRSFVGSATVIGHNIGFDAAFLARHGLLTGHMMVDTYDLASVLLPRAPRYNLNSLAAQVGIDLENAHRALDDARAAALLYWQLWNKALKLASEVLFEIVSAAQGLDWDSIVFFEAALHEQKASRLEPNTALDLSDVFSPPDTSAKPLHPNETQIRLNPDMVIGLIDEGGALAQTIPNYEKRPQQIEMARAVIEAFNRGEHVMIEAGTGTGKSIAYLVPSIMWATLNNERVVISTNTINLQDQLITKDIPVLQNALGIPFRATVLKGRSNYLCPRRLMTIRRRRPTSLDELRTLAKILVWLLEGGTGDKGEISMRGPAEHVTWQRLSAEDEGCTLNRCAAVMNGTCPFYKARKDAEAAHLLVINHALLLSDATTDNRVLPDYQCLVLDEAHHLEEAVTNSLSFRLDESTLRRRLADLGDPRRGLLGDLLNKLQNIIPDKEVKRLEKYIVSISEASALMERHIGSLFAAFRQFVTDLDAQQAGEYFTQIRVTPALRDRASFAQIQSVWNILKEFMDVISEAMRQLAEKLVLFESHDIPDYDDLVNSTATAARYLKEMNAHLTAFINEPDENRVYWISVGQDMNYSLTVHAAPLHIGPMADRYLWHTKETVIMTSATLRTHSSFDYIRSRLHAEDMKTVEVGSPFDYQNSTLLYIPTDIPEPNERQRYQQAVERGIIELAAALNGRVLGLFTSYSQLRQTAQAISPRLALGNITVYDQSDGSSRQALLDGFRSTEKAVLLGTRSFWEGVDIPGESLSALVIVRLPFAVPTDPIFAARSETYSNSFDEYAIPDAILRFRQGFGRLIRTRSDRGVVTVFDRRIVSKSYGGHFLEALPDCTVQYGSLNGLAAAAQHWLTLARK